MRLWAAALWTLWTLWTLAATAATAQPPTQKTRRSVWGADGRRFPKEGDTWGFPADPDQQLHLYVMQGDVVLFQWSDNWLALAGVPSLEEWQTCNLARMTLIINPTNQGNYMLGTDALPGGTFYFVDPVANDCQLGVRVIVSVMYPWQRLPPSPPPASFVTRAPNAPTRGQLPTPRPTKRPNSTNAPTQPTKSPVQRPTPFNPNRPPKRRTKSPTSTSPTTLRPTSKSPTSASPTTLAPTRRPSTPAPTRPGQTLAPGTSAPSSKPSRARTKAPSSAPSIAPTVMDPTDCDGFSAADCNERGRCLWSTRVKKCQYRARCASPNTITECRIAKCTWSRTRGCV